MTSLATHEPQVHPKKLAESAWAVLSIWRLVLAWVVLSGHLLWFSQEKIVWAEIFNSMGGKAAVICFMLISGYSIAASLEQRSEGFYRRRFLRIYPLYFVAIIFAFALELAVQVPVQLPNWKLDPPLGWSNALGNLLLLQTFFVKPVPFDGPVWSLSIEAFYYLLAPLLFCTSRRNLIILCGISATAFLLPKHADWGVVYLVLSKFNALNYLWSWLLGFMLWKSRGQAMYILLGIAAVMVFYTQSDRFALIIFCCTSALLLMHQKFNFSSKIQAVFEYLGDISYPIYLFHLPSFIFGYVFLRLRSPLGLVLLAVVVSIIAYHLIDRFLKLRYIKPLLFDPRTSLSKSST